MVLNYLGHRHVYGQMDCIELIRIFYKHELKLDFNLPAYTKSRQWMKDFSTEGVDKWASTYATKVNLTDARDYDVIAYKSNKSNLIIHFGIYLAPVGMLHIEEGGVSCVETLSDYWVEKIHTLYRHGSMV